MVPRRRRGARRAAQRSEAREIVYGMPYDEWKAKHQKEASGEQKKAFAETHKH